MERISLLREARRIYAQGGNISQHFKHRNLSEAEQIKIIEYAYDLQSGSYTDAVNTDIRIRTNKQQWGQRIGKLLATYGIKSAIEAGVGEASTLRYIAAAGSADMQFAGFDISLSRLCFARQFLQPVLNRAGFERRASEQSSNEQSANEQRASEQSAHAQTTGNQSSHKESQNSQSDHNRIQLFTGDLGAIPVVDNAYDAVLSNHSLESNGGREREILEEMLRVSRRYLVLLEPDYENGCLEQQQRMDSFGYVRGLRSHLENLGARVLQDQPWDINLNPLNAASLIVAEKTNGENWNAAVGQPLASPFSRESLQCREGYYYAENDGIAFPVINGFPCLLRDQGVVATHLTEDLSVPLYEGKAA